jgi:hypothetical protein
MVANFAKAKHTVTRIIFNALKEFRAVRNSKPYREKVRAKEREWTRKLRQKNHGKACDHCHRRPEVYNDEALPRIGRHLHHAFGMRFIDRLELACLRVLRKQGVEGLRISAANAEKDGPLPDDDPVLVEYKWLHDNVFGQWFEWLCPECHAYFHDTIERFVEAFKMIRRSYGWMVRVRRS